MEDDFVCPFMVGICQRYGFRRVHDAIGQHSATGRGSFAVRVSVGKFVG